MRLRFRVRFVLLTFTTILLTSFTNSEFFIAEAGEPAAFKSKSQDAAKLARLAEVVLDAKPRAYLRLHDADRGAAQDSTENGVNGAYEPGAAPYTPGTAISNFSGGRVSGKLDALANDYSVELWFWNDLQHQQRPITGYMFSRAADGAIDSGDHLGIGGSYVASGKLFVYNGNEQGELLAGSTPLAPQSWNHVVMVRRDDDIAVYLNGRAKPEIEWKLPITYKQGEGQVFIGGRSDNFANFVGRIDEVAVYDRALSTEEIANHFAAADASQEAPAPAETVARQDGFQPLFNAQDLSGFYVLLQGQRPRTDPLSIYQVRKGVIHCYADAEARAKMPFGVLVTEKEYSHYHLRFEYKWGEKKFAPRTNMVRDAGLLYHMVGSDIVWPTSVESQVQEGDTGDLFTVRTYAETTIDPNKPNSPTYLAAADGGVAHACGKPGGIERVIKGGMHEREGWNTSEVIVRGDRAVHIVNGQVVLRIENIKGPAPGNPRAWAPLTRGKIAFQAEGAECFYRNIEIKELTPDQAYPELGEKETEKSENTATPDEPKPTSAEASLSMLHVPDGFQVELVAAEPLVMDPVAIDWGPDGKLWVVEMADYPLGMDNQGKPGGRVRYLEDTDEDGRYDKSTLFAEGLSFPTGVLAWDRGVLVTAAPEIVYLEDSTGDGKADVRRVLYSGFSQGNQQLRVNGLRYGLDNWIYCASGSHHAGHGKDSQITAQLTGKQHHIGSRDFRIRPDTGEIDPQSGPSQFGRNRDDWGNWFGVQNSHPLWHYVLADHHIRRNPHFAPPDPKRQIVTPANPKVYPASALEKRYHSFDQSGRFTSACSAMIYRDELLFDRGEEQHAFTCEPFHNLVQHNRIADDGVSFRFRRDPAEKEFDFFASQDPWCRPVMVRTGPDGALWVVDMYRYMIEHPHWLPKNGQDELRPWYRSGEDRGRIYRVVRGDRPAGNTPQLAELSPNQLVAELASPNGWRRDMAQRMLILRKHHELSKTLEELVRLSPNPLARLHALWTLEGLGTLSAETLGAALLDEHADVRRNAVRIAAHVKVAADRLAELVDDADAKVRLELAATLGAYEDPVSSTALADLAIRSADDPYITANVMSSLHRKNVAMVLAAAMQSTAQDREAITLTLMEQAVAMGEKEPLGKVIEYVCPPEGHLVEGGAFESLARVLDALHRGKGPATGLPEVAQSRVAATIQQARSVATKPSAQEGIRAAAIRLLGREPVHQQDDFKLLAGLLVPQSPAVVQQAVVSRLSELSERSVPEILLAGWRSHSPQLREQILSALASRETWAETLLLKLEAGTILASEISAPVQEQLLAQDDSPRWRKALLRDAATNREEVLRHFQSALTIKGDAERGGTLFRKLCTNCHKLQNEGHEVGPNLASVTDKSPEALLTSILDPSAAVDAKYLSYSVVTNDGRVLTGKLETETGSSITLLAAGGKGETILRRDIEELHASTKSVMPEGLEQGLKPQDLADLIRSIRENFR